MTLKRTKIVATLGPASSTKKTIREMVLAGVNVFRINFSHGDHDFVRSAIKNIREVDRSLNTYTAILGDLQGPKIRLGALKKEGLKVKKGATIVLTTEAIVGDTKKAHINYDLFPQDVSEGQRILIDDGKLVLTVVATDNQKTVTARFENDGILNSRKGVNLPDTKVSIPSLTEKDKNDLQFALDQNIHWIGLSFVRKPEDITELHKIIEDHPNSALVVAKIEKPEALENLDDIIQETDAIMVARGDLGVEMPLEEVPLLQKSIVQKCQMQAKPVIIATQMMESMIENISPTRAEVNDVANAVMDGADAVMLSGETSVGKHPVEVIKVMNRILLETETFEGIYHSRFQPLINTNRFITDNVCFTALDLAEYVSAKGIITMTFSGYTAFKISSFRPKSGIFVFTGNRKLLKTMSLVWGTQAFYYDKFNSTDETISDIKAYLLENGHLEEDDLVVNIASMPIKSKGMSNMIKLSYV